MQAYNRAQNIYASAVAEQANLSAIEAGVKAGISIKCQVKIIPTDIYGNILTDAKVTIGSVEGKTVEEFGNIALVDKNSDVNYSVELDGFEPVKGSIKAIKVGQLIHVTLQFAPKAEVPVDPEEPADKVTITIVPTPSDAVVKLNGEVQSSVEVNKDSSVSYEVSKEGYTTKSGNVVADSTKSVEVSLDAA